MKMSEKIFKLKFSNKDHRKAANHMKESLLYMVDKENDLSVIYTHTHKHTHTPT